MKQVTVRDIKDGARVSDLFLVSGWQPFTGNGPIRMMLSDATGSLPAIQWPRRGSTGDEKPVSGVCKVLCSVSYYEGTLRAIIENIDETPTDYDAADFERVSPVPYDTLYERLVKAVASIKCDHLRELAATITGTEEFRTWPAAVGVHHAYKHGLLEHSLEVCTMARYMATVTGADKDMVTAGALLHDCGKVREYVPVGLGTYEVGVGGMLGHIAIGMQMVTEECTMWPAELLPKLQHLLHIIASHHGQLEYGSPVKPATPEALIVASCDALSAALAIQKEARDAAPDGAMWAWSKNGFVYVGKDGTE